MEFTLSTTLAPKIQRANQPMIDASDSQTISTIFMAIHSKWAEVFQKAIVSTFAGGGYFFRELDPSWMRYAPQKRNAAPFQVSYIIVCSLSFLSNPYGTICTSATFICLIYLNMDIPAPNVYVIFEDVSLFKPFPDLYLRSQRAGVKPENC